eukprot:gnl/Chilomastix_caulleri/5337.p1 GENE.gnl/Chilomastix_caulleri/5337~~gnl/Chilomastix_caulleri/5337.p1  ORF type:complete len:65 (+),score=10.21 gnl/Chilomastix_caulleri/5337:13-207(+)
MSSTDAQLAGFLSGLRSMGTEKVVVDEVLKTALNCMLGETNSKSKNDEKGSLENDQSSDFQRPF